MRIHIYIDNIKPLLCSRCNKKNSPELEFCDICHAPLTEMAMAEVDEKKRIEMQDMFNEMVRKFKVEMIMIILMKRVK